MSCNIVLFSKENKKRLIIRNKIATFLTKNEKMSIPDIYLGILDILSKQDIFIFGWNTSDIDYYKSVVDFKEFILDTVKSVFDASKNKSDKDYLEFSNIVEEGNKFLSDAGVDTGSIKSDTEPVSPSIEDSEGNTEEVNTVKSKLSSVKEMFFGSSIKADSYRLNLFKFDLIRLAIIDTFKKRITRTETDLNMGICSLKNKYLDTIARWLESEDPNIKVLHELFNDEYEKVPGYEYTLNKAFNLFKKLKEEGTLDNKIIEGWKSKISGLDNLLFDALCAYINLEYFDDLLLDVIGNTIKVADKSYSGIELSAKFGKYIFFKEDEHKRKDWRKSENRDALKDVAKFSKLLLSTIPIKSFSTKLFTNRYISIQTFTNAIISLFNKAKYLKGDYCLDLQNAILDYHNDPPRYAKIIFETFSSSNKQLKNLINDLLILAKVSIFDINILTSFADYVYNSSNENSIFSIESNLLKDNFTIDRYFITDCLSGLIDRLMDASYVLTLFNTDSGMVETSIKSKYYDRGEFYSLKNRINSAVIYRPIELRNNLSKEYTLFKGNLLIQGENPKEDLSCQSFSISFEDITIVGTSKSDMGVLSNKDMKLTINVKGKDITLKDITKNIDLINTKSVEKLISEDNLNDTEKVFVNLLKFIDSQLDLNFLSKDGLDTLSVYENFATGHYLNDILQSAIRGSIINDLYIKFNTALNDKKNTEIKSLLDFEKLLKLEYLPFKNIDFNSNEEVKTYFDIDAGVPNLLTVKINDSWLDNLSEARSQISGDASKSTTKDVNGNSIANYRTSFLGENIMHYLSNYQKAGKDAAAAPLLFTRDRNLITKTLINLDALSRIGIKKNVSAMKSPELIYQSIVHNFFGNYLLPDISGDKYNISKNRDLHKTILTLATTYSDKVTIVTHAINSNRPLYAPGKSYDGKTIWQLGFSKDGKFNSSELIELYFDTVGLAYINLYKNVLENLQKVLNTKASVLDINDILQQTVIEDVLDENGNIIEEGLISKAIKLGINLLQDLHYRPVKGIKIINGKTYKVVYGKFNELLHYYATILYKDINNLKDRFEKEKISFINDLIHNRINFYTHYKNDSRTTILNGSSKNIISKIISAYYKDDTLGKNRFLLNWVDGNKLIIAKINGKNIISGREINPKEGDIVELNPLLEKYFYTDSVISNNLRFELTGSEINHPDKTKIDFTKELESVGITLKKNPEYFKEVIKEDKTISFAAIDKFNDLVWLEKESRRSKKLRKVYNNVIYLKEAGSQGTLLKRNVIIPATLLYLQLNVLTGPAKKAKVAFIKDTDAEVFNFRGNKEFEKAHDGCAFIDPFTAMLENMSLLDLEVGVDRKPIWHHFDPKTITSTLLKFATFPITSERMRNYLRSDYSFYNLFKLMTNLLWKTINQDGSVTWNNSKNLEFNLIDTKGLSGDKINFIDDILGGKDLYYKEGNNHYKIIDFGFDQDTGYYYTKEAKVDYLGRRLDNNKDIKVYHAFDSLSNHLKFRDTIPPSIETNTDQTLHTINSLFELFNAMGGIYSEEVVKDSKGFNTLQNSEYSVRVVVNFMNNVSIKTTNEEILSQSVYFQPLKEMLISYVVNESAVKLGATNINGANAWKGNTKLNYAILDISGLGMQMDAEHEVENSEMSEFTLVIAALESGGRLHHLSKLIYNALGLLSINASLLEIDSVAKLILRNLLIKNENVNPNQIISEEEIKNELYTIIGRTLLNNYKELEGRVDLATSIIEEIKKKFSISDNHSLDAFKIPFSDSNLFKTTISTLISNINSKSIKRKYPGSGYVMAPSYNFIQTFKYNGKVSLFLDVLKEALKDKDLRPFNPEIEDIVTYNKFAVLQYLKKIQIAENEKATLGVEEFMPTDIVDVLIDGLFLTTIDLSSLKDYYIFKDDVKRLEYISKKTGINLEGKELKYVINVTLPRNLAPSRIRWKYTDENGIIHSINIFDTEPVRNAFLSGKRPNRKEIQKLLDDLGKGLYKGYKIFDFENKPAELVLSNMYVDKFDIRGKSLSEIKDNPNFFKRNTLKPIISNHYDIVLTTNNGNHLYVSFQTPKVKEGTFTPKNVGWKYTTTIKKGNTRDVYATTKEGLILFKVGTFKLRNDVEYKDGKYINKETREVLDSKNFDRNSRGLILEYLEFISNWKVLELGKNNLLVSYNLYTINSENIAKGYTSDSELINNQIAKIIKDIYSIGNYNGIRLNYSMYSTTAKKVSKILKNLNLEGRLQEFLNYTVDTYMSKINTKDEKIFKIDDIKKYNEDLNLFYNETSNDTYTSFLKSLSFTSSRIPAQNLQSFMQMECVGFTESSKNVAYVSYIQTWLLGSDY